MRNGRTTNKVSGETIFTMSTAELARRVNKVEALLAEIRAQLPGLVTMTEEERRHCDGRLRDGESDAFAAVLATADADPQYFESLADKDGGVDPETFETDFLRDRLARRETLAGVASAVGAMQTQLSDTVLWLGGEVRPVLLVAYRIAKSISTTDAKVRARLAPAIDFFAKIARRSAATRQATRKPGMTDAAAS